MGSRPPVICHCDTLGHKCFVTHVVEDTQESLLGKKVFVDFLVPGEQASVAITQDKKTYARGAVLLILDESEQRVAPRCKDFGRCGGCDLQHIQTDTQRELKRAYIESAMRKELKVVPRNGVLVPSAVLPEFNYRNRIQLQVDTDGVIGFFGKSSHSLIEIAECHIAEQALNQVLRKLRQASASELKLIKRIDCILNDDEMLLDVRLRERMPKFPDQRFESLLRICPNIIIRAGKSTWHSSPAVDRALTSFSQVNRRGNDLLRSTVCSYISDFEVTELYAGAGNFAFDIAKRSGALVHAVELSPALVAAGKKRAASELVNGKVEFFRADAEVFVTQHSLHQTVLLDPPRAGAFGVVQQIDDSVDTIVYVSCYLPSLLRDLKELLEKGFQLVETTFVDMFPQTYHLETVTLLKK